MNPIEDRLRAAYSAQAEQLTERRLDELEAAREAASHTEDLDRGEPTVTLPRVEHTDELAAGRSARFRRWAGASLAAAAVIAVAAGAITLTTSHGDDTRLSEGNPSSVRTNHPSTHSSAPTSPSNAPTSSSTSPSTAQSGPSYLGPGQTGPRTDVPWSQVGDGWRLLVPQHSGTVYLYDPADGRYKITDQLPTLSAVVGWSPDGTHAMVQAQDAQTLRELDLRTGALGPVIASNASFASYTRPHGLAVVVSKFFNGQAAVERLGLDGSLQLSYDQHLNGIGMFNNSPLYTSDGSAFVITGASGAFLIGNDGTPLRSYPVPGAGQNCTALSLWDDTTFLELCRLASSGTGSLYLQPMSGGDPSALLDEGSSAATFAWPLSNGDVLIQGVLGECSPAYRILHPDGTVADLRLPAGVSGAVTIENMSGDRATLQSQPDCTSSAAITLTDDDMVTGTTTHLLDGRATVLAFPAK